MPPDPLCYPGTTVLINLLDIRDQDRLEEAEFALFVTRADEPLPSGDLDSAHYLRLHRHLFQDVYAWAGTIRTIRIGKGGNWFCYPEYIEAQLKLTFRDLGDVDAFRNAPPEAFVAKTAHFIAELNAVHPFREGNGRTQLTFLAMLAENAGLPFNASVLEQQRAIQAMIESFAGDNAPLASLIRDIVT